MMEFLKITKLSELSKPGLLVGFVVFWAVLFSARWLYRLTLHPLARFPGPRLAALTSAFAMWYDIPTKTSYIKNFPAWHDQYGPIVRIEPNHLHIRDLGAYNQVYRMGSPFNKDPAFSSFPFTTGSIVNNLINKQARGHRDLYGKYFSVHAISELQYLIKENISILLHRFSDSALSGEVVDCNLAFRCLTSDTIARYIFDKPFDALSAPEFKHGLIEPMENFMGDWTFNFSWYWPKLMGFIASCALRWKSFGRSLNPSFRCAIDQLEFCEGRIQEYRRHVKIAGPSVFKEALNPDPRKGHPIQNDQALRSDAWILFFAGTDTTAGTLCFGIWHLLENLQYMKMLQNELKEAIPYSTDLTQLEKTWAQLEKLPFLRAVVKESLRISYGIPGKLPRIVPPKGVTLCDQFIPGGTALSMSAYSYHSSPEYFSTHDPQEFRPERWIGKENNKVSERAFMPFSRGSRDCLGRYLAIATLYLTFAYLFRRFEVFNAGTTKQDMEWHDGMLPIPAGHLKIRVRRLME